MDDTLQTTFHTILLSFFVVRFLLFLSFRVPLRLLLLLLFVENIRPYARRWTRVAYARETRQYEYDTSHAIMNDMAGGSNIACGKRCDKYLFIFILSLLSAVVI